jgi:hypothetical protein
MSKFSIVDVDLSTNQHIESYTLLVKIIEKVWQIIDVDL